MFIIYSKCNQPQNTQRQRPKGAYLFQAHLKRRGGGRGRYGWMVEMDGLLYLEKMMVSIFSIINRMQSGNAQAHERRGHAAKDPNKQISK